MAIPTTLTLEIVTPDRALVTEQVDEVELPGAEGYFGVLPGHAPLLSSLKVGELWYRIGQQKFYLHVAFGFVEVLPDLVAIDPCHPATTPVAVERLNMDESPSVPEVPARHP